MVTRRLSTYTAQGTDQKLRKLAPLLASGTGLCNSSNSLRKLHSASLVLEADPTGGSVSQQGTGHHRFAGT